jgi:lysophospholipase L1-like esterase
MPLRPAAIICCLLAGAMSLAPAGPAQPAAVTWVGTWAAAPQRVEDANLPPAPGFADSTLRQIVRVSIGGRRMRLRFSNAFGNSELKLLSVRVARSAGGSAIQQGTDRPVTFHDATSVVIPVGASILSDALDFDLSPLAHLAVTIHVRGAPAAVTGHPGSRTTSYLQSGEAASALELTGAVPVVHWYFLSGIEVVADQNAAAIAILGDSITDGRGSTTDGQDRWPDNLARRLHSARPAAPVAVLNVALGGNRLLRDGVGPNALSRFDRDVLVQSGVRWLIVLMGVNDIGAAKKDRAKGEWAPTADDVILAYDQIIERAHARGILVYGGTIMPFGGFADYDTPDVEAARLRINAWIRTSGRFDAVIDFDAVARDRDRPTRLSPAVDGGDHLHPSAAGYRIMADAIDLDLFVVRKRVLLF